MSTTVLSRPPSPPAGSTAPADSPSPGRGALRRLVRYTGVSAVATSTSLVVLFLLVGVAGIPATWSNVVATAVGTVPSFELNRRWVWRRRGRRSLLRQVIPFVVLSFTGLLVSTVAVAVVSGRTTGWSHWGHTLAVEFANVAAYGSLWVVQYIVLDRFLFKTGERDRPRPTDPQGLPTLTGGGHRSRPGRTRRPDAGPRDRPPSSDRLEEEVTMDESDGQLPLPEPPLGNRSDAAAPVRVDVVEHLGPRRSRRYRRRRSRPTRLGGEGRRSRHLLR